jgi:transposase
MSDKFSYSISNHGDAAVMENLSSHRLASVDGLLEAADARLLFLPIYSPNFNLTEEAFARLKAMLRNADERTVSGLGRLVDFFQPQECAKSRGYDRD